MHRCPALRYGFREAELVLPDGESWDEFSGRSKRGVQFSDDAGVSRSTVSKQHYINETERKVRGRAAASRLLSVVFWRP